VQPERGGVAIKAVKEACAWGGRGIYEPRQRRCTYPLSGPIADGRATHPVYGVHNGSIFDSAEREPEES